MKLKFQAKSARVKGISLHPSKPWMITSLHSGQITIWDYNMGICVAKFDGHQGPVRGVDFHPQLPLFVSGGDDGLVKLWDYKQKRCLIALKGHIDYIRSTFFHHQLPWILSACDDQTMRIWNYQSRNCINIITGHSHYVMCAQFHPQKNYIVSCSLDSTVRIWDFTVLRKKLTQTKNASSFIGIEIQCIKILDGHERGCNWVCFHPSLNLIASCSDDRKIKLWKYTNEVAWQHSTIIGHKNNVSCVLFDQKSGTLISNSQDKTLKMWNYQTKTPNQTQKRQNDRYWVLKTSKNGHLLCAGHDSGVEVWEINKQVVPFGLVGNGLLVYAQGMKSMLYDIEKQVPKQQLYQYIPKDKNGVAYINRIIVNQFNPLVFIVQIQDSGKNIFTIKKKQSYLNFPNVLQQHEALDICFFSKNQVAILSNSTQIHFSNFDQMKKSTVVRLTEGVKIKRLFTVFLNEIIVVTQTNILRYSPITKKVIFFAQIPPNQEIKGIVASKERLAIFGSHILMITNHELQIQATINENFVINSAFWQKQNLLFYTTTNHWKYSLMNGQTGVLKTLQQPLHLVKKLSQKKYLSFSESKKVFEVEYSDYPQVQFKLAVINKQWNRVRQLAKQKVGRQKKVIMGYLIQKGLSSIAVELAQTLQQKFSLAIQATNFQMAFEVCNQINTQQHWRLLGQQALKQGIYEAYEFASQKLKQHDKLNFLYSLQNNKQKLQKVLAYANKNHNPILAFNASLFLNNQDHQQQILRQCGLQTLAQMANQVSSGDISDRLKALGCGKITPLQPEGEHDFSNWAHNVVEEQDQA